MLSADEVWRLQGGRNPKTYRDGGGEDPECCSFQEMAGEGHYGSGAGTKQGIYVCTSAGRFLASINSNSPKSVAAMLRRALDAWSKLPEAERAPAPAHSKPSHRWEWSYPEDGMVLEETFRYLPGGDAERKGAFNRDYAWFSADEAKLFVSASPASGEQRELPEVLFHRLARQHLLNSVRGESGAFAASEVSGSLHARVLAVDDDKVRLRITGTSTAVSSKPWDHWRPQRIEARLIGFATFDRKQQRVERFDLVAKGTVTLHATRQGGKVRTRPIGWLFTLAPRDTAAARLSPTHLYAYDASWVTTPKVELHALPRKSMRSGGAKKRKDGRRPSP